MTSKVHTLFISIYFILFCSLGMASPPDNSVGSLLDLSGLSKQVGEIPGLIKTGFLQGAQQGSGLQDDVAAAMLASADRTILPSVILDEIRFEILKSVSDEEIAALLQWYKSDLGRKITLAEETASTPEAYENMLASAEQLLGNTPRVESAVRFDALLGSTDMTVAIQKNAAIATYSAIMTAVAPDQDLNLEDYKAQLKAVEPQMREYARQSIIISFVYSYQFIDDDSLARYEAFLRRPETIRLNKAVAAGLGRGFEKVAMDWAADIGSILKDSMPPPAVAGAKT